MFDINHVLDNEKQYYPSRDLVAKMFSRQVSKLVDDLWWGFDLDGDLLGFESAIKFCLGKSLNKTEEKFPEVFPLFKEYYDSLFAKYFRKYGRDCFSDENFEGFCYGLLMMKQCDVKIFRHFNVMDIKSDPEFEGFVKDYFGNIFTLEDFRKCYDDRAFDRYQACFRSLQYRAEVRVEKVVGFFCMTLFNELLDVCDNEFGWEPFVLEK